jgi:signal transduction histidine kinase
MKLKIFEAYFQVDDPKKRTRGGMGVGLFLVKQICDRMNATVEVSSEVGQGSTFTVRVPIATALAS